MADEHRKETTYYTDVVFDYFTEELRSRQFFKKVEEWAESTDQASEVAEGLMEVLNEEQKDPLEKLYMIGMRQRTGAKAVLKRFEPLVLEIRLTRAVDNYLTYLADLLSLIFTTKPETLRSKATVRLDDVLKHEQMEDFVGWIAEREVNNLSYQSMESLDAFFLEHLGFELFEDPSHLERGMRIIETRNLIVHNRSILNERAPRIAGTVGLPIELEHGEVVADINFLNSSAFEIDSRAIVKFDLPAVDVTAESATATTEPPEG